MNKTYGKFEKFAYVVIFIITAVLLWLAMPFEKSPKLFIVLSGSMEPEIHTGSVVVTIPQNKYRVDEIVTFKTGKNDKITTTHRIISEKTIDQGVYFTTKGDANNTPDMEEIPSENILGRVVFSISKLGYILDFIRRPISILIIVIIPAIFIIFDETKKIIEEVGKMKDGKNKIIKKK
ncbi:MAG TPA: signal peptidase I [Candidatus Paceibacterota bacterium]|nr:signal peptidase I [Candidatus Paceibacterota bacterium]